MTNSAPKAAIHGLRRPLASAMAPSDKKAAELVSQYRGVASKEGIAGTPDEVIEVLRERELLGLGYSIHYFPESAYDRSGVELFETQVIPALA